MEARPWTEMPRKNHRQTRIQVGCYPTTTHRESIIVCQLVWLISTHRKKIHQWIEWTSLTLVFRFTGVHTNGTTLICCGFTPFSAIYAIWVCKCVCLQTNFTLWCTVTSHICSIFNRDQTLTWPLMTRSWCWWHQNMTCNKK